MKRHPKVFFGLLVAAAAIVLVCTLIVVRPNAVTRQELSLMGDERDVEAKLLASIHAREKTVFGKSGLLKTRLAMHIGNKQSLAATPTYGAKLQASGSIDLSADAQMLKEGDKAIAEADTASKQTAQSIVKALQVKPAKRSVSLATRRKTAGQKLEAEASREASPDKLASQASAISLLAKHTPPVKLLVKATGNASPMSKAVHAAAKAQPAAMAQKAAKHTLSRTIVSHESNDISQLKHIMAETPMTPELYAKDAKKLALAEKLLMGAVKRLRNHPAQSANLKQKELSLTIDALQLKKLQEALKEKLDDVEHEKLMTEHHKQMQQLQGHIDAKRKSRLSLTAQLRKMQQENAHLKDQVFSLTNEREAASN